MLAGAKEDVQNDHAFLDHHPVVSVCDEQMAQVHFASCPETMKVLAWMSDLNGAPKPKVQFFLQSFLHHGWGQISSAAQRFLVCSFPLVWVHLRPKGMKTIEAY
jgi:hypothetical protein